MLRRPSVHRRGARAPDAGKALPGLRDLAGEADPDAAADAVDTTRGVATVFPALTLALIRVHQGDRAAAEAAYLPPLLPRSGGRG
jgi:hypothetical protein